MTNNDIREFLGLSPINTEFNIESVSDLGANKRKLMFINKPNVDLFDLLSQSFNCVFLVEESIYPDSYITPDDKSNDIIQVKNPKFKLCRLLKAYPALKVRLPQKQIIGHNCMIDPGVILGGTDFSPVMGDTREELVQFPQMGGIKIGDNVLIKYNSMIGKGTFGYTQVGDNTMIDYNCQVGHNSIIGKSCIIAAGTIIGGSAIIGDCVTIGMGSMIRNGIKIGNNVSIGMGSVVLQDVPDNCVVVGNPAKVIKHDDIFDERGLR